MSIATSSTAPLSKGLPFVSTQSLRNAQNSPLTYDQGDFFDEMFDSQGIPWPACARVVAHLRNVQHGQLKEFQQAAIALMRQRGVTFNVYGDTEGSERLIPFDVVPRVIADSEWTWIERGLKQRVTALNLFLQDVYGDQQIVKDGVVPSELINSAESFRKECVGLKPPHGVWCHITGTDLIRDETGKLHVLEDNLRCPSGVSYVLENRKLMKQTFPGLFSRLSIRSVDDYGHQLLKALRRLAIDVDEPRVGLLTPGNYNSAYFEHSFLAQQMGVDLVEGRDLVVRDKKVYAKTTRGLSRIDVLYRRIDDVFLDPTTFRADSLLGVPGLMDAYVAGNVALANAPGTGVADDKAIYAYVPDIIRFYLTEEPILPNVTTYACWKADECQYVMEHLDRLVVKPVNESGGYGLVIGPQATAGQLATLAERIRKNPRDFIAQPVMKLSQAPVVTEDAIIGRHVDLRPFVVYGTEPYVLPGGLTRVALREGSLIVNSSQGGGSKDTWVVQCPTEGSTSVASPSTVPRI